MASNGIISNDLTADIMAHMITADGFEFIAANGQRFPSGLGCAGGWTMLKYKTLDTSKLPPAVKAEIEKAPPEKVYGSAEDPSVFPAVPIEGVEPQ